MKALTYIAKTGREIESVSSDFARLRIAVFRDFPYLYEGAMEYEMNYMKTYANSENSFLFAVYDGDQMVGATTCIPLKDETHEVQLPFIQSSINVDSVFYFGESILLPEYRGYGIGHRFFDKRENHAKSFRSYSMTCFCSVDRPENHPLKPANYRTNDAFWTKRGYRKNPGLQCEMSWPDLNEKESTSKNLTFWTKEI